MSAGGQGKESAVAGQTQRSSIQHGSMTLQARDGPVTLMGSNGAQMGFTLAPRDFNDCCNPRVQQWLQRLRTDDFTNSWLEAISPCTPSQKLVDLSCATFMDDVSDSAVCSPTVGRRSTVQDEQSTLIPGRVTQ